MKTVTATFHFRKGAPPIAVARFASASAESKIQWSGNTQRLAEHLHGKLINRRFAGTFATAMRTIGGYAGAQVDVEETGEWNGLEGCA